MKQYVLNIMSLSLFLPLLSGIQSAFLKQHCSFTRGCLAVQFFFLHFLINCMIFRCRWGVWNIESVFWFSLHILTETFLILRIIDLDLIKMYVSIRVKYLLFLSDLKKLEVFRQTFEKSLNVKFHYSSPIDSRVVPSGQTRWRYSRFAQFREHT